MCHHICPIGNATGHERSTARARALGISLVNRNAIKLSEIMDNIYECCTCGGCVNVCVTGWDPVMFTKETRLKAALEGALPEYINKLVDNCLETGNAYGETEITDELKKETDAHSAKTDTLLYLGTDARFKEACQAIKAIKDHYDKDGSVDFSKYQVSNAFVTMPDSAYFQPTYFIFRDGKCVNSVRLTMLNRTCYPTFDTGLNDLATKAYEENEPFVIYCSDNGTYFVTENDAILISGKEENENADIPRENLTLNAIELKSLE